MFKISGFYDEASSDLGEQLAVMKSLGGKYLCPRGINGRNISSFTADEFGRDVLPVLKSEGVKLSSIGSPIGKIPLYDDAAYEKQVKQLKELAAIAALADCKYIRCFSFFIGKNADYDKAYPTVVEKFKGFADAVEDSGVTLLHENEKKIFGDVPERALAVFNGVNRSNVKLCYDASNYIQCGVDARTAYEATKEFTVYYHMKDCADGVEVPLGTGQGAIRELIADLVRRDYDGFLTLEPHTFKYAFLKRPLYLLPFLWGTKLARVYRRVDKDMGVKPFESVSRVRTFEWQYKNLVRIIGEAGGEYE
ncbi:MAG: sugar phosphate isomerase/epimerase [Clostridiaceae bacterium]|jgi:sugar phosphate isomerase/epimerase|nr:sugar phosphate isomerase/epimerase [Clostridiaceae bacterium]